MPIVDFTDWMDEFTGSRYVWYVKRLSGNDTLANGTHQAGPYIPKEFLFSIFPALHRPETKNPDVYFQLYIDSHADHRRVRAVWYNNKLRGGTRNEARVTNFGGASSALLDPDSTGALTVFAFPIDEQGVTQACHVWVCRNEIEEDIAEDRIGMVDPGQWKIWTVDESSYADLVIQPEKPRKPCWLEAEEIPPEWIVKFPKGSEIIEKTLELRPDHRINPDIRLIKRRECEFEIFRSLEEAVELPRIKQGFDSVDEFIARAQTILQRRKSRSGRSLELHAKKIFIEEGLKEDSDFSHQPESDPGQKPDFLFPSEAAYKNPSFPENRLRMLAVKTTCKDRWRQILKEANRIHDKHLLTLQEGVSENQFREMTESGVQLVVPAPLVKKYPGPVQQYLKTFESFIGDIRMLSIQ